MTFQVHPIGLIHNKNDDVRVEIYPEYRDGLLGIEQFSHILVIYWLHENDRPEARGILQVHPRHNKSNPLTGVFATHAPVRPNLIGLTRCRLLEVVEPVVVSRSVDDNGPIVEEIDRLHGYLCSHLSADYRFDRRRCHWQRKEGRIHLLATPPLSVSSSQVRQRIREGNPVADLVPPAVNAYLDQKDLYR